MNNSRADSRTTLTRQDSMAQMPLPRNHHNPMPELTPISPSIKGLSRQFDGVAPERAFQKSRRKSLECLLLIGYLRTMWHETQWPGSTSMSGGSSVVHSPKA